MPHKPPQFEIVHTNRSRKGSVLLVVLVVVVLLTLGAYSFTEIMLSEAEATAMYGRDARVRAFADSGVELVAATLDAPLEANFGDFYHAPQLFQGIEMHEAETDYSRGRFSVVAPVEAESSTGGVRFGVIDESGKLNLNALATFEVEEADRRMLLMGLPEMTFEIADGILDWIDDDELPREYGAEYDVYESLDPPYTPRNGPLESLDELLAVRGMTPWLLYGEDTNRNGLLDLNENDGDVSLPVDNGDGVLERGWSAYFTVHSRERNLRSDGTARVHLNQESLEQLYDSLELEFTPEIARFVTAFRMAGPAQENTNSDSSSGSGSSGRGGRGGSGGGGNDSGNNNSNGNNNDSSNNGGGGGGGGGGNGSSNSQSGGQGNSNSGGGTGAGPFRGGLDLSAGAKTEIKSIYDMFDTRVQIQVEGENTTLESPWQTQAGIGDTTLNQLVDTLSVTEEETIFGRININLARREVLLGIPKMTESLADDIVASSPFASGGQPSSDTIAAHSTTGWLLSQRLVTVEQMRQLDPFITARGDVYRAQVVGYFDAGGAYCRLEAVIDASQFPARVKLLRDLTELGRGFAVGQLNTVR